MPCCGSQWRFLQRAAVMDHGTVLLKAHLHPGLIHLTQPGIPSSGSTAVQNHPPRALSVPQLPHAPHMCVCSHTPMPHAHARASDLQSMSTVYLHAP